MVLTTEMTPHGAVLVLHHSVSEDATFRIPPHVSCAFETEFSLFYALENQTVLAKIIKPKSFAKDYLRRYFLNAEAVRVFWSTRQLGLMGIAAPEPLGFSVILNPFSRYESIYYAAYKVDGMTMKMRLPLLSKHERGHLLAHVARDYARMINHRFTLKDLHFENVLVGDHGERWWIDVDLRRIRSDDKLLGSICQELGRLRHRTTDVLSPEEWECFNAEVIRETHVVRIPQIGESYSS